ncbi:amino acid synthesis family protein [Streptomyces sp. NBC_00582]|uniref:amino acid synthesis family protein n=1 Tax=Streptomyces sp. NBC_00582 TaxID=2975783 RepID=UPI00106296A0|nr:amino acid synthesis family protein [Streptomyces sp. NBC_00582]WUB67266.1 amino acid synthesis family protein [Streptomyces sp. NBC_00582]
MTLVDIRKTSLVVETIHHEGGPRVAEPVRVAAAAAVVRNPFAGRHEPDLTGFQSELRALGVQLATELVDALDAKNVQAYGKGAIVGVNGELEHGAVWHEAGGWAMRAVLGEPKAIVPSTKAVAATGYRLLIPLHHIEAAYVRSHFNTVEVGVQDAPRPDEILYALAMATGGRVHARVGGLTADQISVHDGNR